MDSKSQSEALTKAKPPASTADESGTPPSEKSCLLLCGGLPGTGKSSLAKALVEKHGFLRIATDEVRKELAGIPIDQPPPPERHEEVYSREFSARTYKEVQDRVAKGLAERRRVIMDATFTGLNRRHQGIALAENAGVPVLFFCTHVDEAIVRKRLANRMGDESDADESIYDMLKKGWGEDDSQTRAIRTIIDNSDSFAEALEQAEAALMKAGLL